MDKEKLYKMVDDIVEVVETSMDFGFSIKDNFPVCRYKIITTNGKKYKCKMEINMEEI